MKEFEVHPFADIYPMLDEEDLQELADDIKANGLLNPIIVKDGVLIDGRNRLAACKLAGVKPTFVEHDGQFDENSIKAFVLSLNNNRRHLNKAQKAMAVAIAWPEAKNTGRAGNKTGTVSFDGIHTQTLSQCRHVIKYAPSAVAQVMAGDKFLAIAVKEADAEVARLKKLEEASRSDEEKLAERRAIIAERRPDLVFQVEAGQMTVDVAEKIISEEIEAIEARQVSARLVVKNALTCLGDFTNEKARDYIVGHIKSLNGEEMEALFSLANDFTEMIESITGGE
jgi:hypothetical protein